MARRGMTKTVGKNTYRLLLTSNSLIPVVVVRFASGEHYSPLYDIFSTYNRIHIAKLTTFSDPPKL